MARFRATTPRNRKGLGYLLAVAALHVVGVGFVLMNVHTSPGLLATAILAYTLGLRHAFDPDHLAAIDNSVRRFVQVQTHPHGTGFWFSLGHSTVVFLMALGLAFGGTWLAQSWPEWAKWGGVVGPMVSGLFLLAIGAVNFVLWWEIWSQFRRLRRGGGEVAETTTSQGAFYRVFRRWFQMVNRSWHLYPLGFLFGLGFDTASEVALLALSTQGAAQALPWTAILALPLLFTAGMSLLDTVDGLFMTKAYTWSTSSPLKKVYYNLSVTGLSVCVAVLIGAVELAQVIGWVPAAAIDLGNLGYYLVAAFVVAWAVSVGVWKLGKLDSARQA